MPDIDLTYFQHLKGDIARQMRLSFPKITPDIEQWKGNEIRCFQEDLVQKVNGRISEKWFYTHIKSEHDHVPRIDILNLLSQYVGYKSWDHYKGSMRLETTSVTTAYRKNHYARWGVFVVALGLLLVFYISFNASSSYQFCFVNAYSRQPVLHHMLYVTILQEGESPYPVVVGEEGCLHIDTQESTIRFVVKGPYYQTDTITRMLNKDKRIEQIALKTNDYAWMIHIFSSSKVEDWQKRRVQLDSMFAEDARIYQIFEQGQIGMEMYNKWEFIDKLTMPVKSLRHIEVLETLFEGDRIKELRFKQINPGGHE